MKTSLLRHLLVIGLASSSLPALGQTGTGTSAAQAAAAREARMKKERDHHRGPALTPGSTTTGISARPDGVDSGTTGATSTTSGTSSTGINNATAGTNSPTGTRPNGPGIYGPPDDKSGTVKKKSTGR